MKDKYGNYTSTITFDDGVSGYYRHKDQNDDYFKVDQEAEFEVEEKSNAQGNKYNIIKRPKKGWQGNRPYGWVPKSPGEVKRDAITFSANIVKEWVVNGTISVEKFKDYLARVQGAVNAEVDKIKDE